MSSVQIASNAAGAGVFTIASPNSASSYTATLPAATTTLVGTDATQTLTNKTLASPDITTALTLSGAAGTSGYALVSGGSGAAPSWAAVSGYGVGQTLTNYSSSGRAMGTTYTNSTGKPISVMFTPNASGSMFCSALIDGSVVEFQQFTPSGGGGCAAFFIMVPNGSTYQMRNDGNASIAYWYEWR